MSNYFILKPGNSIRKPSKTALKSVQGPRSTPTSFWRRCSDATQLFSLNCGLIWVSLHRSGATEVHQTPGSAQEGGSAALPTEGLNPPGSIWAERSWIAPFEGSIKVYVYVCQREREMAIGTELAVPCPITALKEQSRNISVNIFNKTKNKEINS